MTDLTGQAPRQRFCPTCGTQSDIEWRYCAGCGGRLPRLEDLHGRLRPEQSPAAEPETEPAPEPVIEPVPEPVVEASPAAAETAARQIGPGHAAQAAERRREVSTPLTEPPRHGVTPRAEPRSEHPRRRRGGSDRIAALIEGPGAGDRDRKAAGDGPDEVAVDPQVLIDATSVDDPQVLLYLTPAVVPAAQAVDPQVVIGVPGADDHEGDDATDVRGLAGEIHLEPLPGGPDDLDAGAIDRPHQGRVTTYVQFAAVASAALGVTLVAGLVRLNRRLESFGATGDAGPVEDADRLVERVLQPAFFVCVLVLLAGLVWWTRLRRVEVHALGFRNSRFSDGLAAGSWLIPGANLVLPAMVFDEMWRASRAVRQRGEWDDQPANPWLWAWALLIGAGVVLAIAAAAASPSTVAGTIDANTWSGIGYALMSLGLLVLVLTLSAVATTVRLSLRVARVEDDRPDVDLLVPDPVTT